MKIVILRRLTVYFVVFGLILSVAMYFIEKQGYRRALDDMPIPVQVPAEGHASLSRDGYDLEMDFLYKYTLEGLVTHTKEYDGSNPADSFSPVDIAVAWRDVARLNKEIDFKWAHGNRFVQTDVDNYTFKKYFGSDANLIGQYSNNHLIPADDRVRKEVQMIRKGDHIILEGYLVNSTFYKNGVNLGDWNSSTTRYDYGKNTGCEIIYVTNIKWVAY